MNISIKNENGHVTLALSGRLDTSVCRQASSDIDSQLSVCDPITSLTCDLSELTYISSSGLRILLRLLQKYRDLRLTDVQPMVYDVFEMSGFTKIMHVEKGLRRLSLDGCAEIGRGGVGTVYRLDDDTIIKLFREGTTLDAVQGEIALSKEAFVMGMPTAISFDTVRVGSQYGLVYELLRADTLGACLNREPERVDEYARLLADLFRQMHATEVPEGSRIPDALAREERDVRHIGRYFDAEAIDTLLAIVGRIPHARRLLHGDLQTKNAMLQEDGELMLIDMGEVGFGHPIIDLAHAYSAMVRFSGGVYEEIFGISRDLGSNFFHRVLRHYFSGLSEADLAHRIEQIDAVSCVRNFSWLALSDNFPEDSIRQCQETFQQRVASRKDYLVGVCDTLSDWTL